MSGSYVRRPVALWVVLVAVGVAVGACGGRGTQHVKSAETVAVEAKAGDFADYWAEVVRLSRRHAAHPDSFRAALDSLPGTHLSDAEWDAWIAPYRAEPVGLAVKLERTMTEMTPPPPTAPAPEAPKVRAPVTIPEGSTPPPAAAGSTDAGK